MKAKWLIVLIIFLIAVSFGGKAAYAAPADDALSALYQYYEICSNEDIEAYMDIMDFSGGEGFPEGYIENTRNLALAVWDNYDILSYELSNIEVSVDDEGEYALISYHIYQELRGADSEGNIKTATMDMDYVALMHDMEGWKVVYLMPRVAFEENMRNIAPIIAAADIIEHLAAEEESINRPPIASFYIMPENPKVGDYIAVASTSFDPDGDKLTYSWYRDGSEIGNSPNWEWENPQAGEYNIKLVVDDGKGGSDECSTKIKVIGPTDIPEFEIGIGTGDKTNHPPTASFSIMPQNPTLEDTIVGVSASSDPDGDTLTYSWYFNGEYDEYIGNLPNWTWPNPQAGEYNIKLVVEDGKGGSDEDSRKIKVIGPTDIPGFEIALLIGAIVVALIIIKRRKHNL